MNKYSRWWRKLPFVRERKTSKVIDMAGHVNCRCVPVRIDPTLAPDGAAELIDPPMPGHPMCGFVSWGGNVGHTWELSADDVDTVED